MIQMAFPKAGSRHWHFFVALGVGIVALLAMLAIETDLAAAVGASAFSLGYLVLTARDLPRLDPDYLRKHVDEEDAPPFVVFVMTLAIVGYTTTAMFFVVNDKSPDPWRLGVGVASVMLAWLMIHVMWGMQYAWEYYAAPPDKGDGKKPAGRKEAGGLEFPGETAPDGGDFIYFALVVAMTAQTSDTEVTSRKMRRIVTGHGLFCYLFNTVIVAAAVNIVVSLGQ
jgi:uncharacterized membrane protein